MYNIYTVKGIKSGVFWQFKYDLNGDFISFKVLEGKMNETQKKWLFDFNRFPYTENALKGWIVIKNFEITCYTLKQTPL